MVDFIKMFIDFDKNRKILYINYYLEDNHYVLKIPLEEIKESDSTVLIENFDLSRYIYLIHFD